MMTGEAKMELFNLLIVLGAVVFLLWRSSRRRNAGNPGAVGPGDPPVKGPGAGRDKR